MGLIRPYAGVKKLESISHGDPSWRKKRKRKKIILKRRSR